MRFGFLVTACILALAPAAARADTAREELVVLEHLAAQAPDSPDAHFDLAMAYARTPALERGWDYLQRVLALDPAYADKLVARLEPRVAQDPRDIEAHWRLAFAYYFKERQAGDLDARGKAALAFRKILEIDPAYVWAYNYLAYITYEDGDLPGALDLARRAVAASPENAVAHFLLGQALLKQNQPFQAAMSMARAMQLRVTAGYGLPGVPAPSAPSPLAPAMPAGAAPPPEAPGSASAAQ